MGKELVTVKMKVYNCPCGHKNIGLPYNERCEECNAHLTKPRLKTLVQKFLHGEIKIKLDNSESKDLMRYILKITNIKFNENEFTYERNRLFWVERHYEENRLYNSMDVMHRNISKETVLISKIDLFESESLP